jgi:NAD(P)-dependent dehydrogenase (short-subunit alcohol dehydrogenase family)
MGQHDGKVGIVTGAGSGIGRATAQRLAQEGARVIVADINEESAKATVDLITEAGGEARAQWADVAQEDAVAAMCQAAVDAYGALHLLHSNAADVVIIQRDIDVTTMEIDVWDQTLAVNLRGGLLGAKYAIPPMIEAGGGAIVYMSSCAGQFGDLSRVAYGVSKAGIESLTRYVATQYGKQGIRCNAVAPGVVATPALVANVPVEEIELYERSAVTPSLGKPDDIAGVVSFLLGDDARFITGQVVNVDGGMRMHTPLYGEQIAQG